MDYSYDRTRVAGTAPRGAVMLTRALYKSLGGARWLAGVVKESAKERLEDYIYTDANYFQGPGFSEYLIESVLRSKTPKVVDSVLQEIWEKVSPDGGSIDDTPMNTIQVSGDTWRVSCSIEGGQFRKYDGDDPDDFGQHYESAPKEVLRADGIKALAAWFGSKGYPYIQENWVEDHYYGDEYWNMELRVSFESKIPPENLASVVFGRDLKVILGSIDFASEQELYERKEREEGDYWQFKRGDVLEVLGGPGSARQFPVGSTLEVTKGGDDGVLEFLYEGKRLKLHTTSGRKRGTFKLTPRTKSQAILVKKARPKVSRFKRKIDFASEQELYERTASTAYGTIVFWEEGEGFSTQYLQAMYTGQGWVRVSPQTMAQKVVDVVIHEPVRPPAGAKVMTPGVRKGGVIQGLWQLRALPKGAILDGVRSDSELKKVGDDDYEVLVPVSGDLAGDRYKTRHLDKALQNIGYRYQHRVGMPR